MATGEITREEMIAFIRAKDEFYRNVDLSALTWEELTLLWETVRATWLLGKENNVYARGAKRNGKGG